MNGRLGTVRLVLQFLRTRANQRYTVSAIAETLGIHESEVAKALASQYACMQGRLQREAVTEIPEARPAHQRYVYWIGEAAEFAGADPRAFAIARWMLRRGKPARPTEIAVATGVDVPFVAQLLEEWRAKGTALRCELLMRSGVDRFEYRMTATAQINVDREHQAWRQGLFA